MSLIILPYAQTSSFYTWRTSVLPPVSIPCWRAAGKCKSNYATCLCGILQGLFITSNKMQLCLGASTWPGPSACLSHASSPSSHLTVSHTGHLAVRGNFRMVSSLEVFALMLSLTAMSFPGVNTFLPLITF